MSVIDLEKTNEKHASLSLKLRADSGYSSDATGYRVSANQWSAIIAICEDGDMGRALIELHAAKLGLKLSTPSLNAEIAGMGDHYDGRNGND